MDGLILNMDKSIVRGYMNKKYTNQAVYFRVTKNSANVADDRFPLMINCTGVAVLDTPFATNSPKGRLDYYLMYMIQGELEGRAAGNSFHLTAGDLILYPPRQGYTYRLCKPERMVYLWIHFTGSACEERLLELGLEMGRVYHPIHGEELEEEVAALHRLLISRPSFYEQESNARLELLLARIARYVQPPEIHISLERLQRSLDFLQRHYGEKITLEQLAGMEYLSVSRYAALFHQLMGRSPQQHLIDLRLSNARQLLWETNLNIGEVARRVGYEDALYFSRLFKRYVGQSPRDFRKK